MIDIDWGAAGDEALRNLITLLRFDTTNPPGNELEAMRWVAGILEAEGLSPVVLESAPGRGNLVCRLKGAGRRGALILDAHLDVVPVDGQDWTRPPFEGKVIDGFVWGRGTLDMKHMAAMSIQAMLLAKRHRLPLEGDLVLVLTADEEAGGEYGAGWLAREHPELLDGEYCLGEVGGMTLHVNETRLYPVMVAEKGLLWLKIRIKGDGGHGSIPRPGDAMERAADLVRKLARTRFPIAPNEAVRRFLDAVGEAMGQPSRLALKFIQMPGIGHGILRRAIRDRERAASIAALLSHTVNPTVMQGGSNVNVIPSEVEIKLDCRLLPGTVPERFVEQIQALVGPDAEVEIIQQHMGSTVSMDNPLYRTIEDVIARHEPGAKVVPYMITGFTNGHAYLPLGVKYMGFTPAILPRGMEFTKLFHAADERIPVGGFKWGVRVLYEVMLQHLAIKQ